jgi:hypothetical protein
MGELFAEKVNDVETTNVAANVEAGHWLKGTSQELNDVFQRFEGFLGIILLNIREASW